MAPTVASPATIAANRAIPVTRVDRLDEAVSGEREAAASALAALHGTLAAGVLAALHQTLAVERELAIARIVRLGAERAAALVEIPPASGASRSIREGTGSALILAPGSPDNFRGPGTELSAWRGPGARIPPKYRRLLTNTFALLAATVVVVAYYKGDIWSTGARQTSPVAAERVVHTAAPADALSGDPLPSDPRQRVAYFRDRAEAGDAAAQYALGVQYARGDGVAQNYASAASWFRKAAEGGIVNAQDLAALYQRGLATPQDFIVAAYWYRNAAEKGVEAAMTMLALLYERGQGVGVSPIDAYAWYRAAARRGDAVAGKQAAALFAKFDGAEKARAVMRAAEIVDALHEPRDAPSGSATLIPGDWIGRITDKDHTGTN